jgi:aminoglycoside 6'-N-acetyltransferase I
VTSALRVMTLKRTQVDAWGRLRSRLWPARPPDQQRREMADLLADPEFNAVFVAIDRDRAAHAFIEASLRMSAEGCRSHPIGYIEGWYIEPEWRAPGVAGALLARAEAWAASQGCREMAMAVRADEVEARAVQQALGYEEVASLAHYRKELRSVRRRGGVAG